MKPSLAIVKIGGRILEEETMLHKLLQHFSDLPGHKILVHGGGRHATEWGARMGIQAPLVGGRRITDAAGLDLMVMVYAGLLNTSLVARLQALNCNALGLSGADADSLRAHKRRGGRIDYGFAGDMDQVNSPAIQALLESGFVPVFCAITHDGNGQLLNTNADTIASELAIAMSRQFETTLYYCFEKPGVLRDVSRDDSVILKMDRKSYADMLGQQTIADGMLPKLENCFHALDRGVHTVCVGDIRMLEPKYHLFTTLSL